MDKRQPKLIRHPDEPRAYFVTVVKDQEPLLGAITGGTVALNAYGHIVRATWQALPRHYGHVSVDACTVMPSHAHGIILIDRAPGAGSTLKGVRPAPERHDLFGIVRTLKTFSANRINTLRNAPGKGVWGRGYYDHAICDDDDLKRIRDYIRANPLPWRPKGAS